MSQHNTLSESEIREQLKGLPEWSVAGGKLHAEFVFEDFKEAFAFMTRVAIEAEAKDHHPEWTNVYNRVTVTLSTHDAGDTITSLDVELARYMSEVAKKSKD